MSRCLEVNDLEWSFRGNCVLKGITFCVEEGEILGCIGRNGSGKSALINILSTLMPPTGGEVRVCGLDAVKEPVEVRKRIGAVFERFSVPGDMTPFGYLYYYGELSDLAEPVILEREEALMKTFGISEQKHRKLSSLSEEVVRKVEICRALISYPKVLLLDEPTRGLDLVEKKRMWAFLRGVAVDEDVAIFLTSHDLHEISELCNRVAVISDGKLSYCGTLDGIAMDEDDLEKSLTSLMVG